MTKYHKDWAKIVELLLIANFWMCAIFFYPDFTNKDYMFMVVYEFKFWREKFKIVSQPEPELSLPK